MKSVEAPHYEDDVVYPEAIPFVLFHLTCLGAFWSGVTWSAIGICVGLYATRMFAITAGYHRYFSHRSFKTSRIGQFVLAFLCQSSAQRGVIWWAAKHRAHHKHSDTELDPHSPKQRGFWFAHLGWIFSPPARDADYSLVPDLTRFPELRWLDRQKYLPAMVLGIVVWLVAGWPGLFVGFFLSTVLLYHCSFAINSFAHLTGNQRYLTGDDSRNSWWLALLTFGEGWHNNHHHYQSSLRQGFYWWEIDVTFYLVWCLSLFGLTWDLRSPPAAVVSGERRLGRSVTDKVARQLARSFSAERIAQQIRESLVHTGAFQEFSRLAKGAHSRAAATLAEWHLPHIPSLEELRTRAHEMFLDTPSMEEIVHRSHEFIVEAVSIKLLDGMRLAPAASG